MNTTTEETNKPRALLRLSEVEKRTGFKKTAIYDKIRRGTFPAPVPIGSSSRWVEAEIDAWIADLVIERDKAA